MFLHQGFFYFPADFANSAEFILPTFLHLPITGDCKTFFLRNQREYLAQKLIVNKNYMNGFAIYE